MLPLFRLPVMRVLRRVRMLFNNALTFYVRAKQRQVESNRQSAPDSIGDFNVCDRLPVLGWCGRCDTLIYPALFHKSLPERMLFWIVFRDSASGRRRTRCLQDCAVSSLKRELLAYLMKFWMEHGTLDSPVEYLCDVGQAKARYLRRTGESEKAWEVTAVQEQVERFASGSSDFWLY